MYVSSFQTGCEICKDALKEGSKNKRTSPSLLVRWGDKNILIDCGRSFKDSMLKLILEHQISSVDAVILTHGHLDAVSGLDDLREMKSTAAIPTYLDSSTHKTIFAMFPHLVDPSKVTSSGFVASLACHLITSDESFQVHGLEFTPLQVVHGSVSCLGFAFGDVVYISDVSLIPEEVYLKIEEMVKGIEGGRVETLIVDALSFKRETSGHFNLPKCFEAIKRIKPVRALLIGMGHGLEHHRTNGYLEKVGREEGFVAECSYDGMIGSLRATSK